VHVPLQQRSVPESQVLLHMPQFVASFATQLPPQHSCPALHWRPHIPQLLGSVIWSAQIGFAGAQQVVPAPQVIAHPVHAGAFVAAQAELQQRVFAAVHWTSQLPHAAADERVSTQLPLQHEKLAGQALPQVLQLSSSVKRSAHCELQHKRSCPQSAPQALQLSGSLVRSTHCPPQQESPPAQGRLHPPQWFSSVRNKKSSSTSPSQSSSRLLHASFVAAAVTQANAPSTQAFVPSRQMPWFAVFVHDVPRPATSSGVPSQSSSAPSFAQLSNAGTTSFMQLPSTSFAHNAEPA
jgi:hypothetical protein